MPLLLLLCGFYVCGVGLGLCFPVPFWAGLIACGGSACAVWIGQASHGLVLCLAAAVAFLALGWTRPPPAREAALLPIDSPCLRFVEASVARIPHSEDETAQLELEIELASRCLDAPRRTTLEPAAGKLWLTVEQKEGLSLRPKDRVRILSALRLVKSHLNYGVHVGRDLGPRFSARVPNAASIALVGRQASSSDAFFYLRHRLMQFWTDSLGGEPAHIARALVLGESRSLDPATCDRFRRTGTAHLLSVSGLHFGMAMLLVFFVLRRLLLLCTPLAARWEVGRLAALAGIPLAILLAMLVDSRPPVVRACVMTVAALVARALGREAYTPSALGLAALLLLVAMPEWLREPGFQLSFAAVIAFAAVLGRSGEDPSDADPLLETRSPHAALARKLKRQGAALARACLAAAAATTPLTLYHFGYASWIAPAANLFAVPFTSFLVLPLLFLTTFLAEPFPALAALLARPSGLLIRVLDKGLENVAALPCTVENPGPLAQAAICAVCLAVLLGLTRHVRACIALAIGSASLAALAFFVDPPPIPLGRLTVDFLDVGHGDAILITFPDRRHWLVDAGGGLSERYDPGSRIVLPVLRGLGVTEIDKLVLTHPDYDHLGGMAAVVGALPIGEIWETGWSEAVGASAAHANLRAKAQQAGIAVRLPKDFCTGWTFGSVLVRVLHPCGLEAAELAELSSNDSSIVLELTHGLVRILLTGDIEESVEEQLLSSGAIRTVDVLKLAHHGSSTSTGSAFLDATTPRYAVVSRGRNDRPSRLSERIALALASFRARILRTDNEGGVRLITDGRVLQIETAALQAKQRKNK